MSKSSRIREQSILRVAPVLPVLGLTLAFFSHGQRSRPTKTVEISAPEQAACVENALVDLNYGSRSELECLPGIGPAMAQRILDFREAHRGFASVDQLDEVHGIGPRILERLRPRLCAELNSQQAAIPCGAHLFRERRLAPSQKVR